MNTSKQINIMVLLVFVAVFVTGAYVLWDPNRAEDAEETQLGETIERAAFLFSANCRTCHGDSGEGGGPSGRLREAPALNRPDLQGRAAEGEPVDELLKQQRYKQVFFTISCGRVGKFMPAWSQVQGGALNDEQIKLLTVLITEGGEGWDEAKHFGLRGNHLGHDPGDDRLGLSLAEAIDESVTTIRLNGDASLLAAGNRLSIERETEVEVTPEASGEETPEAGNEEETSDPETRTVFELVELMEITAVDTDAGTVTVERGLGRTNPTAHEAGTEVFAPPVPPAEPAVTEQSCGQTAQGGGGQAPVETTTTPSIIAQGTAWNTAVLSVPAGQPITLTVDNRDDAVAHNFHLTEGIDPGGDEVAATDIEPGPIVQTLNFGPLEAGDYYYVCDVHLNMEGVLTAVDAGAATPATDSAATP